MNEENEDFINDKNDYTSEDIIILKRIFQVKKEKVYYFHKEYLLSPGQLSRSIGKFEKLGVILEKDGVIQLSEVGVDWILKNRFKLFIKPKNKYWKVIPESMKGPKIDINSLYLPSALNLDIFKDS